MSQSTVTIPIAPSSAPTTAQPSQATPPSQTQQPGQPSTATQPQEQGDKSKLQKPPGSAFAALDRREKAIRQEQAELQRRQQEFEAAQKSNSDLFSLPLVDFINEAAKRRGISADDMLREYVATRTGAPTPDKALADATDPAIVALRAHQDRIAKENEALKKELEARDKREQERQQTEANAAARAKAIGDCMESAKSVFTAESDYAVFYPNAEALGEAVYKECSRRIQEYIQQYKVNPELEEVDQLVKDMPAELLKHQLESHVGKNLKTMREQLSQQQTATVPGFRPRLIAKKNDGGNGSTEQPKLRTKMDHEKRLEDAIGRWPSDKLLPGQQPPE